MIGGSLVCSPVSNEAKRGLVSPGGFHRPQVGIQLPSFASSLALDAATQHAVLCQPRLHSLDRFAVHEHLDVEVSAA